MDTEKTEDTLNLEGPDWCRPLLVRLAVLRAALLDHLVCIEERALVGPPVFDDWTVKDVLAHIAAWDQAAAERVELVLAGREDEIEIFTGDAETARNAAIHAERRDWPLNQVVEALVAARARFLAVLSRLPEAAFSRPRRYPGTGEGQTSVEEWTVWRARHDAAHIPDLTTWRETNVERRGGSKAILTAAMAAARQALLSAAALVPPAERRSTPMCGIWTLQDLLGHLADWEQVGVEGLRNAVAGRPLGIEPVTDFDPWNRAHVEARRGQTWDQVWADLQGTHQALVDTVEGMDEADLSLAFAYPWGGGGTACRWVRIFLGHDLEHTRDIRESVEN